MLKTSRWIAIKYTYFLIISLTLILVAINFPWNNIPLKFDYYFIALAIIGQIFFLGIQAIIWAYLVKIYAKHTVSFKASLGQCGMVAIGKYIPGKVWGLVGRGVLLVKSGAIPANTVMASFIEQILLLHSGAVLGLLLLSTFEPIGIQSIGLIAIALLSIPIVAWRGKWLISLASKIRKLHIHSELCRVWSPIEYLTAFALFFILWVIAGLIFASIYFSIYPYSKDFIPTLIFTNVSSLILGFIAFFAPAGIGVRDAAIVAVAGLTIPIETAIVLALVYRAWTIVTDIISGLIAMLLTN